MREQNSLITAVKKNLFKGCCNLRSVIIPEKTSSVEDHAFSGCTRLNSILFLSSKIRFGKDVFSECFEIHKLRLPDRMVGFNKHTFNEPDYVYITNLPYASVPQQLQPPALKGIAFARISGEKIEESIFDSYRKSINRHKDDWIYEGKIDENEIFISFLAHEKMLNAEETEHLIKRVTRYQLPSLLNVLMQYQSSNFEPDDYSQLLDDELNV